MSGQFARVFLLLVAFGSTVTGAEAPGWPPYFGVIANSDGFGFIEYHYFTYAKRPSESGIKSAIADDPIMEGVATRKSIAEDSAQTLGGTVFVYDVKGNRLKKRDAIKRLSKGTPIVISRKEKLKEFYSRHFKPETMVLVEE